MTRMSLFSFKITSATKIKILAIQTFMPSLKGLLSLLASGDCCLKLRMQVIHTSSQPSQVKNSGSEFIHAPHSSEDRDP